MWYPTVAPEALVESRDSAKGYFGDFSFDVIGDCRAPARRAWAPAPRM